MIVHRGEDVRGQYPVIDRLYQGGSERVWILWKTGGGLDEAGGHYCSEAWSHILVSCPIAIVAIALPIKPFRQESQGREKCMFHPILRLHCMCDMA